MTKTDLKIIPQKFSFSKPTITDMNNNTLQYGIDITISIDAFQANKEQIKKDLTFIFAEVLEYFE